MWKGEFPLPRQPPGLAGIEPIRFAPVSDDDAFRLGGASVEGIRGSNADRSARPVPGPPGAGAGNRNSRRARWDDIGEPRGDIGALRGEMGALRAEMTRSLGDMEARLTRLETLIEVHFGSRTPRSD